MHLRLPTQESEELKKKQEIKDAQRGEVVGEKKKKE